MILDVPYVKQVTQWSCAIAAMEMVARYHGHGNFNQHEIFERIKLMMPGHRGHWCVSNKDLIAEAQRLGFDARTILVNYTSVPEMMETIKGHLERGEPLIATQRTAMQVQFGHSRVIVGHEKAPADGEPPIVVLHDPAASFRQGVPPGGANRRWKADTFAAMWKHNAVTAGGEAILITNRP